MRRAGPRVSIGLPVYNGEAFLAEAIDSVLAQTFDDFELIICDNGSTDATEHICRAYAESDPRVRYHRNEENLGAAYNFNRALDLATGEYFRWTAADDVCHPELVERLLAALHERPGAVVAYPRALFIDAHGRYLAHSDDLGMPEWGSDVVRRGTRMFDAVFRDGRIANVVVFGLMPTAALRGVRPIGSFFASDRTLVCELAIAGEIIEVPDSLIAFRRHDGSSSGAPASSWKQIQQAFYDPRISGRLREEVQFRRHYVEAFRAVGASSASRRVKAELTAVVAFVTLKWVAASGLRRVGLVERPPHPEPQDDAPTWQEYFERRALRSER